MAIETHAWDGTWYRRAYLDEVSSLDSASNAVCKIDSISQSWAVLCRAGDPDRAHLAMRVVDQYLVKPEARLVQLLTPAFKQSALKPGYIKGYVPRVRENGG